jgi:hypothetical protein
MTVGTRADRFWIDARNRLVASGFRCLVDRPEGEIVTVALPAAHQRWRCAGCGNLTRFDVTRNRRTTEFWHFDLAGERAVEDTDVREEVLESVTCRWCGRGDAIELVERTGIEPQDAPDS